MPPRTPGLPVPLRAVLAAPLLLAACSRGPASPPADASAPTDAGPAPDASDASSLDETPLPAEASVTRPYRLGTGGVQLLVTGLDTGLQLTPANTDVDDDVIDVHQEYYGVPWAEASQGDPPPPAWVAKMHAIQEFAAVSRKPVFLSISMLDGTRTTLAPRTVIQDGNITTQPFTARCFDFATDPQGPAMKQAYLAYVAWMMNEFDPVYLDVAIEVNLFFESCPAAAAGVIDVSNAAYDAAKALLPGTPTFPSFQMEHLYGHSSACPSTMTPDDCFDASYAQIAPLKRDRFAMSTYPTVPGVIDHPSQIPADWFSRAAARGGERAVISETGWSSSTLAAQTSAGTCVQIEPSTEADTAAYLQIVLAAAQSTPMDFVDWWGDWDLVVSQLMTDCPCTFDATWCGALGAFSGSPVDGGTDTYFLGQLELKAFGAMGLRDYAGTPKPTTFPLWQAALAVPHGP